MSGSDDTESQFEGPGCQGLVFKGSRVPGPRLPEFLDSGPQVPGLRS